MDDEPTDELPGDPAPDDMPPDDEGPEEIPVVVMGAMKDRMHARRLSPPDDPDHVEVSLGGPDDDIHVVDDGPDHCMIGRPVGYTPDGCVYVLVGRLSRFGYEQLRDGDTAVADAFSEAGDISLCAVFAVEGTVQNIALVRHFRRSDDIPAEYLPPGPFLEFSDDEFPD